MINAHRAARLTAIEDDMDEILGWEPSIVEDPEVLALLDRFEEELICNGDL